MKTRVLSVRQFAAIKRVAMNVNPLVVKKNKIAAKIDELNKEYNDLVEEIEGYEMGVMKLTDGMVSENLVVKKVEDTGKVDKEGKPIKKTVYEPKEGVVTFNPEANVYEIQIMDFSMGNVAPEVVDDTEMAPETEVETGEEAPFDPANPFNNGTEAGDKLPFEE